MEDISLTGLSFWLKDAAPDLLVNEDVTVGVTDSYGESYTFTARVRRVGRRRKKSLIGTELIYNSEDFTQAVKFVYGDSQRWLDSWKKKSQARGVGLLLWSFFKLGVGAQKDILFTYSRRIMNLLARLAGPRSAGTLDPSPAPVK